MPAEGSLWASLLPILLLLAVPALLLSATSFVKLSVVFAILKSALGAGEVPSAAVITALAAILSFYVMAPVGAEIAEAAGPAAARIDRRDPLADMEALGEAYRAAKAPLARFLRRNSGAEERALFLELAERRMGGAQGALSEGDLLVLLPAFLITELAEAFQLGFLIFLPFLIVELVVANILVSLGMHSLSPARVSLPFKLLLFVLAQGWLLLSRALVLGYA
jgi:type III secretion protein R